MPTSLGRELFSTYVADPSCFSSPKTFADIFPGIYITNSYGSGHVVNIKATELDVYYHKYAQLSDTTDTISRITDALSLVILIFFISALALAFIVLYNLSNINIIERTRELATLKVLGFVDIEIDRYIYRENVIISIFGILAGLFLGVGLHSLLIRFTAIDTVMYGQDIEWHSYLIALGITVLIIISVNLVLHQKLKKVDMVLSLKSVE